MRTQLTIAVSAIALTAATAAQAASTAHAVTDLNLRAAPAPDAEIVDVIDAEDEVSVELCVADTNWCEVSYEGAEGWAYGAYLAGSVEADSYVAVTDPATELEIRTVTREELGEEGAALGAITGGAAAAALVGGPIAVAGGLILGGSLGAAADVEETTVTYIRENPVDPLFAEGEVVVGATLPEAVTLYPVPDSPYEYVALNNTTVVVDPESRTIVHVIR